MQVWSRPRGGQTEPPKIKKNETFITDTLTWPHNARNPISKGLNLKKSWGRTRPERGSLLWQSVSQTLYSKILYLLQQVVRETNHKVGKLEHNESRVCGIMHLTLASSFGCEDKDTEI